MNENVVISGKIDPAMDEALALTTGADYWTTIASPANGIRSLRFADGPHGLRVQDDQNPDHLGLERSAPATCFPPAVTLASSWDADLIQAIGEALGREAKAAGVDVVLGPGLNIKRSPLCGRNFEYFSEDPFLTGMLSGAAARGLQNEGVAACLKHFAVNNQETDRLRVSANVDDRTLREIYLRAFQIALRESCAWSVMSSYNRINGLHASENPWLMTQVLRNEWGFDGVVVSDWGAVRDPVAALQAGLDVRMPGRQEDGRVKKAFEDGRLAQSVVTDTVERLRLLAQRTDNSCEPATVDYAAHNDLVRLAACQSAVLLTNDGALPLSMSRGLRIGVVGELARSPRFQGAGSSRVNAINIVNGLDALAQRAKDAGSTVEFAPGYALSKGVDTSAMIKEAVALCERVDVVVMFLGLPGDYETEGRDRTSIDLPPDQLMLLQAVAAVSTTKIVALSNGSAVTTNEWRGTVNSIVEFWLTGQAHGDAIADILLGGADPGGRLAETIPVRLEDTPSYFNFPGELENVTYGEGIFVGYRHYDGRKMEVDFPFGHGLSYTSFEYSDLAVTALSPSDEVAFIATLKVCNVGQRPGSDVVQLYVEDRTGLLTTAPLELRGWKKINLQPGEKRTVEIDVKREDLMHWHTGTNTWVFPGGAITVHVGASSRDLRISHNIDLPGHPVVVPLTEWSTLGEWLDHPQMGPRLQAIFTDRGGVKGRIGDLLVDETGKDSVRGIPLGTISEFPGVPLTFEDLAELRAIANDINRMNGPGSAVRDL